MKREEYFKFCFYVLLFPSNISRDNKQNKSRLQSLSKAPYLSKLKTQPKTGEKPVLRKKVLDFLVKKSYGQILPHLTGFMQGS